MNARDPALQWRPLPEATTQPPIRPYQWIVHTAVDGPGPTDLRGYFERHTDLESHTWLRWDRHEQLVPFTRSADANYRANRWRAVGEWRGAVSTETEDDGDPVGNPWNAYQLAELIRFGTWLARTYGIPPVVPRDPYSPGMGWHCLFPGVWSNVPGKTCPGPTRIHQFTTVVLPAIRAAIEGDEIDMATMDDLERTVRKVLNEAAVGGTDGTFAASFRALYERAGQQLKDTQSLRERMVGLFAQLPEIQVELEAGDVDVIVDALAKALPGPLAHQLVEDLATRLRG